MRLFSGIFSARWYVALISAAYLLLGLINHDLWRIDDAVTLSIAHGLDARHWIIPRLAGEPWLNSPPLYHWIAAALGNGLSPLLPWHDAARLASALVLGGGLFALSIAVKNFHGEDAGRLAPLLAIGTLGLLVPAHEAQPALTSFLAVSLALAALSQWNTRPPAASITLGLSVGVGFLGSGLSTLLPLLGIIFAALMHPHWRSHHRKEWMIAFVIAALLVAAWPLALHNENPQLFQRWLGNELQSLGGNASLSAKRIELLAWSAWPVLPLGLWMLWLERRRLTHPTNFLGFAGLAVTLILFLRTYEPVHGLMPMLAMLVLIATPAAGRLRRGAANAFDWFGGMALTLFIGLIWLGGIAILTGAPERVAKNFSKPAPGFIAEWSWWAVTIAVIATVVWLLGLFAIPRSPWRAARRWALGVTVIWTLLATLWLPWVDYGKSYRSVSAEIRKALGSTPGCIERRRLDEAHRASLDYFGGIRTVPIGASSTRCNYRISQNNPASEKHLEGWTLLAESARPGDKSESFRVYRRND
jgi:4-amino-4-deoxy-L-arabinose transferase-like glycosyltransferase